MLRLLNVLKALFFIKVNKTNDNEIFKRLKSDKLYFLFNRYDDYCSTIEKLQSH